jgi:two-component system LytT family sensor kinase
LEASTTAVPDPRMSDGRPTNELALRWIELVAVVAFWAFFALLSLATAALDPHGSGPPEAADGGWAGQFVNPAVWLVVSVVGLWLTTRVSLTATSWRRGLLVLVALGLLVANGADVLSDATWDAVIRPGLGPDAGERRLRPGLDNFTWLDDYGVFLAALGAGVVRGYVLRTRARRDAALRREVELEGESARHRAHAAQLDAQLAEARLEALRRQLDPHFLFNTLNSVSALVERDPRGVRRMVGQLSDLLRHSMDDTAPSEIALRQELEMLERYVDIMRVRFADQLAVETKVDPRALDALVPNMILQPLVENAIRHGVEQRSDGGRVEIDAALDDGALVLRVRDNGPLPPQRLRLPVADGSVDGASGGRVGVGLRNTAARLAQLYGADYRLTLGPGPDGGTVAEVRLPHRTAVAHAG